MSTRGSNNAKTGQKYQNTFAFKHNKNSMLTRKIRETPLDLLCKRCLEKVEWRITFRKYKPLTSAAKCNKCDGRNIYKAYRTICDKCSLDDKLCSKCTLPVGEYAKPTNRRNDPNAKSKTKDALDEIVKDLKVRCKRTVERKLREGECLIFDKEKGIINEDTGDVVIDIKIINGDCNLSSDDENDNEEEQQEKEKEDNKNEEDINSEEEKDNPNQFDDDSEEEKEINK